MGELMRPQPRRSVGEHAVAVVRWVGVGRIVGSALAVLGVAAGAFWLLRSSEPQAAQGAATTVVEASPPTVPPMAEAPITEVPPTTAASHVVVHVAGAVAVPGVYELAAGARVADGIAAAGGAGADAVLDAVNLAAPLLDGQQVYVPHAGEATGPAPAAGPATAASAAPIDLNAATEEELESLPGIGPVTAAAIVRHREEAGPYATVEALLDVPGIGPARLASLDGLIRV